MTDVSFPQFSNIPIQAFPERLSVLLKSNLEKINSLLLESAHDWDTLMKPLDDMDDALEQLWSPLVHLHAVVDSAELRACYQECLPKLSAYEAAIGHNEALYLAIKTLNQDRLNPTQRKIIQDSLLSFELSGVALSTEQKHRFEAIQARLATLANQYENNVLDSAQAYTFHITDESQLQGIPEHALHRALELAGEKKCSGWVLNLEFPLYLAVVTYADDRSLREEIYRAFVTRASDQGPLAGQFDNTGVMDEILALRHEKAGLLGFANYAELSLATKMASSEKQVVGFLEDLIQRAHKQAVGEFAELQAFAREKYALTEIAPWDIAYLSEKKKQATYAISEEELRLFFPLDKVMRGLFSIVNTLYGMTMERVNGVDVWHPDVICYGVKGEDGEIRGYIYVDLFARQNKRGGAWMDSCRSRRKLSNSTIQLPIATLTCNFAKPAANKPPTLSHDEVLTLFHELGHCLHHVLTQVDYLGASGINGVEWDAVELPSQFFENWCWEEGALKLLTGHVDTGEPLPRGLFEKLIAAKNFQSAIGMMRQLEFSVFDFRIHRDYQPERPGFIASTLQEVRKHTQVLPIVPYNRFQHSFSHIFAGGYAAGYYSYKWAEVLSCDAFSRFEEEGVLNSKTGHDFLHQILEVGGSRPAAESFLNFRGREAKIDALLKHNGISCPGLFVV